MFYHVCERDHRLNPGYAIRDAGGSLRTLHGVWRNLSCYDVCSCGAPVVRIIEAESETGPEITS